MAAAFAIPFATAQFVPKPVAEGQQERNAQTFVKTYADDSLDAAPRLTDPGGDGQFDKQTRELIELLEITISTWTPTLPEIDLYTGQYDPAGEFVRLDLLLDGLVNPPYKTAPDDYNPFKFGPNPIYGFIELDIDQDTDTGGELDHPRYRYGGNIARFGSTSDIGYLNDRIALDASAFDGDFTTAPFVDRSGEEFHLAFLGSLFNASNVDQVVGDNDLDFEAGEVWWIEAPWFHRAHGYEPFSLAVGGAQAGEYAPVSTLQFEHDPVSDTTLISLVFPLTNEGAALMNGEPAEPNNADSSDQFSIVEGLTDLRDSAVFLDFFPTGLPEEEIITGWRSRSPGDFVLVGDWRITALLGTCYTSPEPSAEHFVWTDVWPNGVRGDVNGDGADDESDRVAIQDFITQQDAADGTVDGRAELAGFASDFSVFDVNHNGMVDDLDVMLVSAPGDLDDDADVDLADFTLLQTYYSGAGTPYASLERGVADLDADGDVDAVDVERYLNCMTGPVGSP